jgi:predicted aldo/keto reductase-like oxidoreductase
MPDKIPTRPLGRTGKRVPLLGFGTAASGYRRSASTAAELYHAALNAGVTYFDTAPTHTGYGLAQKFLAPVLRERRREIFLVTKCHESDGDTALRQLDANLKELRSDYADLVHVHSLGDMDPDKVMGKDGVLAALARAKKDGKLKHIGLSGHSRPGHFVRVLQSDWANQIDVVMLAMNFADRHTYNFESRVAPIAAKAGAAVVAMKVFGGAVFGSDTRAKAMSNAMMPDTYHGAALRYAWSLPNVACAVIGMATEEELRENLARARSFTPLPEADRRALAEAGQKLAARWGTHYGPV